MSSPHHPPPSCPLCRNRATEDLYTGPDGRRFRQCPACRLVFVPPEHHLPAAAEQARYATHQNSPADPAYRAFLDRLAAPLVEKLSPGWHGLDYGAGPGPTLSVMLAERGFRMAIYDPFFAPERSVIAAGQQYDFITCTETAEHFARPAEEFEQLERLLRPGGWLAIMTGVIPADRAFADWWYIKDPTHIAFYAEQTLAWIAARFGWAMERPAPTVVMYRKPEMAKAPGAVPGLSRCT